MLVDDGTSGLSGECIGLAIGVHRKYGPGLVEKVYLRAYADAIRANGHTVECERALSIVHADVEIKNAYRPDVIVDGRLVIEVKSVTVLLEVHKQQLATYMRLAGIRTGLLINFNVPLLRRGIRRILLPNP